MAHPRCMCVSMMKRPTVKGPRGAFGLSSQVFPLLADKTTAALHHHRVVEHCSFLLNECAKILRRWRFRYSVPDVHLNDGAIPPGNNAKRAAPVARVQYRSSAVGMDLYTMSMIAICQRSSLPAVA